MTQYLWMGGRSWSSVIVVIQSTLQLMRKIYCSNIVCGPSYNSTRPLRQLWTRQFGHGISCSPICLFPAIIQQKILQQILLLGEHLRTCVPVFVVNWVPPFCLTLQLHVSFNPAGSYAVDGLKPDTLYRFSLAARSEMGLGVYTQPIEARTAQSSKSSWRAWFSSPSCVVSLSCLSRLLVVH